MASMLTRKRSSTSPISHVEAPQVKRFRSEQIDKNPYQTDNYYDLMTKYLAFPARYLTATAETSASESEMDTEDESDSESLTETNEAQYERDYEQICEVHPDVDPVYIRDQLISHADDPSRVSTVVFHIFALEKPPSRDQREAVELILQQYEKLNNMTFDLDTFLKRYPKPQEYFSAANSKVTDIYHEFCLPFLMNHFKMLRVKYIRDVLESCNSHLTPAFNILRADADNFALYKNNIDIRRSCTIQKYLMRPRSKNYDEPKDRDVIDEGFFWERLYVLNQMEIHEHFEAVERERLGRVNQARAIGQLYQCDICVNSEVLKDEITCCPEGHMYCSDCVRRSVEELLSQGRTIFPCLNLECEALYQLATLETILEPQMARLLVQRIQTQELIMADIENLVSCPFCPFAIVIPHGVSSNVFHCENPACMEDSCRLCGGISHIPLTCTEFKAKTENKFERFMENEMAEAMIRQCPKCKLRFVKSAGCNTIQCACRATLCYGCGQDISGKVSYHFKKNNRCARLADAGVLHRQEVEKAFQEAKEKFIETHSDFMKKSNVVLETDYNPLLIPDPPSTSSWWSRCVIS